MPRTDGNPSPANVPQMLNGYQQSCVLVAAFRLGIFDGLADGAKGSLELAVRTGAQPAMLERLLRALVAMGLLKKDGERLSLPAHARLTLESWRDAAILIDTQYMEAWHALAENVLTGETAFDKVFGTTVWQHREENPGIDRAFNSFGRRLRNDRALLDGYDWSRVATIADVGGGHGHLIASILKRHGEVRGILFDQPHVLEQAKGWIEQEGVSARCTLQAGSFFESVPSGADLYVLQHVLHDWNDEQCSTILRSCRSAMIPEGTLLIIEHVLPEESPPLDLIMLDLHMMAVLGGRERTRREYEELLSAAGLEIRSFREMPGMAPDIIECGVAELPR